MQEKPGPHERQVLVPPALMYLGSDMSRRAQLGPLSRESAMGQLPKACSLLGGWERNATATLNDSIRQHLSPGCQPRLWELPCLPLPSSCRSLHCTPAATVSPQPPRAHAVHVPLGMETSQDVRQRQQVSQSRPWELSSNRSAMLGIWAWQIATI